MQFHFFSIPATHPQQAADELNRFMAANSVVTIDREFVSDGSNSYWAICAQLAGDMVIQEKPRKRGSIDYREVLSPEVFARFARIRTLRNEMAEQQGTPAYAIFTNEQLAQMAALESPTRATIAAIEGIGEKRMSMYADAFIDLLEQRNA